MPIRKAQAAWNGSFREGEGTMRLGSGAFEGTYSYRSRMEDSGPGTSPEELLGAAHAGCFSMSLARRLSAEGYSRKASKPKLGCASGALGRGTRSAGSICARRLKSLGSMRSFSWRRPRLPSATARCPRRLRAWRRSLWRRNLLSTRGDQAVG